MKQSRKSIIMALTIFSLVLLNCLGPLTASPATAANLKPNLKQKGPITLSVGDTFHFEIINKPSHAEYEWSSDRKAVAVVDQNGLVQAVAPGSATISSV